MAENKLDNAMNRLLRNVADTYSALYEMGADQPPVENSDNLPATARTVKAGGTGTGGGASIDVTAEVGQTIVVKEVDANGKPTKWESADYQPRTHWTTTTRKAILDSTTVEYNADFGSMVLTDPIDLVAGNIYTVVWNGTEYTCTAFEVTMEDGTAVVLGDMYTASGGAFGTAPTGEPFVIMRAPDELAESVGIYAQIMSLEGLESAVLSISENVVEYHHLDSRYIKDMYRTEVGVILPETTADVDSDMGAARFMPSAPLIVGNEYTIVINGTEYVRTATFVEMNGETAVGMGNIGVITGASPNEDMFVILCAKMPVDDSGNMVDVIMAMSLLGEPTVTLSISDMRVVQIPKKYIPKIGCIYEVPYSAFKYKDSGGGYYEIRSSNIPRSLLLAMCKDDPIYLKINATSEGGYVDYIFSAGHTQLSSEVVGILDTGEEMIPMNDFASILGIRLWARGFITQNSPSDYMVIFRGDMG